MPQVHGTRRGLTVVAVAALLLGGLASLHAALTTPACLAKKLKEWGNLRKCQATENGKALQGKAADPAKCQTKLDEKLAVPKEQGAGAMPQLPQVDGMAKLKKWNLPSNVHASFDSVAKPKMDASLAQGKAKMVEAESKRDAGRTQAVKDSQDKVKSAHADADKQQQAKVA